MLLAIAAHSSFVPRVARPRSACAYRSTIRSVSTVSSVMKRSQLKPAGRRFGPAIKSLQSTLALLLCATAALTTQAADAAREPELPLICDKIAAPEGSKVEFDAVGFAYVPGTPVLEQISFTAMPGQTIAIVGPTGAGKTTVLSLIARLRDATSGAWSNSPPICTSSGPRI